GHPGRGDARYVTLLPPRQGCGGNTSHRGMAMTTEVTAAAGVPRIAASRAGERKGAFREKLPVLVLFLPPALVLFTLFVILPIGEAAWYSLYNWNGYGLPDQF